MAKMPDPLERLLTVKEAAVLFRVSEKTVRRWIDAGLIGVVRPGGRLVRIVPREIERFVATSRPTGLTG